MYERRKKRVTMASPNPNSKRSKRRKARGFTSLERDSRKHRRAFNRLDRSRTLSNYLSEPGSQIDGPNGFSMRAGGAYDYHSS